MIALLALLCAPAMAQDPPEDAAPVEEPEAPAQDEASEEDGEDEASEEGEASEEAVEDEAAEGDASEAEVSNEAAEGEASAGTVEGGAPVAPPAPRPGPGPIEAGNAPEGYRITPFGHGSGVGLYNRFVVGPDGGTNAVALVGRYGGDGYGITIGLPFAAHRTPEGRTLGVGNLALSGYYELESIGSLRQAVGIEGHVTLGDRAYTWVNGADEIWPGAGADLVWQARTEGDLSYLLRGSVGVHGAADYDPYPGLFLRVGAAGGVDYQVADRVGLVGEMAISYWDLSPWEISGLVRADLAEGVRARAGIVAPIGVWAGTTPTDRPGGLRETTLLLDVSMVY